MCFLLTVERETLENVPNILTYQTVIETEVAGYLVRQWLASNLYDRISTWPFLTVIEKLWISYQLLYAMREAAARDIAHGDLKCENVLVTTSLCVYITDLASSFKPDYLPLDDPTDFSLFFDTSGRRTCYIAPERFYESLSDLSGKPKRKSQDTPPEQRHLEELGIFRPNGKITEQMDVFSLGCVLAELWREGKPMFTLIQLYKYRSGNLDISNTLAEIPHDGMRQLLRRMLQRDPKHRPNFDQILADAHGTVFPVSFGDFLHLYLVDIQRPPPQSDMMRDSFQNTLAARALEPDDRIEKLYEDWAAITVFFGNTGRPTGRTVAAGIAIPNIHMEPILPVCETVQDTTPLILLDVILANVRFCMRPSVRLHAIELILHLAWGWLSDDTLLDRVLPLLVALIEDSSALVRSRTVYALSVVITCIERVSVGNVGLVLEYLMPKVGPLAEDPSQMVRCMYAEQLDSYSTNSLRLLALEHQWHVDATMSFDTDVGNLQSWFTQQVATLLSDSDVNVRCAILARSYEISVFLGQRVSTFVPILENLAADPDWRVRTSVLDAAPAFAEVIPAETIYPLVLAGQTDSNEAVVVHALRATAQFVCRALVDRIAVYQLFRVVGFFCHPCAWIREASIGIIVAAARQLPEEDVWTRLYPAVRPLLLSDITALDEPSLWASVSPPLKRELFHGLYSVPAPETLDESAERAVNIVKALRGHESCTPTEETKLKALAWYFAAIKKRESADNSDMPPVQDMQGVTPQTVFFGAPGPSTVHSAFLRQVAQRRIAEHAQAEHTPNEPRACETIEPQTAPAEVQKTPPSNVSLQGIQDKTKDTRKSVLSSEPALLTPFRGPPPPTATAAMSFATAQAHSDAPSEALSISQVFGAQGGPFSSTYEGSDPYVMAHLELVYNSVMQRDVQQAERTQAQNSSNARPHGTLIAALEEHQGTINAIAIAPDHAFFVSGDACGTIKVWDTARLEKNVTSWSRITYAAQNGAITAVLVLAGTHCVASTATDRSIHVWTVISSGTGIPRYGVPQLVQSTTLDGEYAMCMVQLAGNPSPLLAVGTSRGCIRIIDVRSMDTVSVLENDAAHGAVHSLVLDRERNWICAGMGSGALALWDLRFHLRVDVWKVASAPVSASVLHPSDDRCIIFSGDTVGIFDLSQGSIAGDLPEPQRANACPLYASRTGYANDAGFVITGSDRIRFCDLAHPEQSVSLGNPVPTNGSSTGTIETFSQKDGAVQQPSMHATQASHAPTNHADLISAISVIERPYRCIVAGDRSGSVRVWE